MKRFVLVSVRIALITLALVLLATLAAAAFAEAYGVPEWAANGIRGALAEHGIAVQTDSIGVGLTRGIVLEHANIRLRYREMPLTLSCRQLQVRLAPKDLFSGCVRIRDATIRDADAILRVGPASVAAGEQRSLHLERGNGWIRRRPDGVVALALDGLVEKIAIRVDAELRNPETARRGRRSAAANQPDALPEILTRLAETIANCRLTERDAAIGGRLTVDLERPESLVFDGEATLFDVIVGNLLVSRYRSDLHYQASQLRIDRLEAIIANGQAVTGSFALDLNARRISGRLNGQILPSTLREVFPALLPAWLDQVTVLKPLAFTAELAPSPLSPAQWLVRGDVRAVNLVLPGVTLGKATATAAWDGETLTVERWRVDLDAAGTEFAEGALRWHSADRTLEGDVTASCNLTERASPFRALRQALNDTKFTGPLLLTAKLERSPADWRRMRLQGDVAIAGAQFRGRTFAPVKARIRLNDAVLSVEPLTMGFPDGADDAFTLSATVNLAEAVASGTWKIAGDLSAKAIIPVDNAEPAQGSPKAPTWGDALSLRGVIITQPLAGAIEVTAAGTAYPDRLYATFESRLKLPAVPTVQQIHCVQGSPLEMTLRLSRADTRQRPRLLATVRAADLGYADLRFKTLESNIEFTSETLVFSGLRATTQADDQLSLDLRIDFNPLAVTIRNGHVAGHPGVIATFIDDRNAKDVYHTVWSDFRWHGPRPATIDLRQLAYRTVPGTKDWNLTLDANLRTTEATYRGLPIVRLDANVLLNLPASATVQKVRLQTDSATAEGQVAIAFGSNPKCTFELRHVDGGIDPLHILRTFRPDWGTITGDPAFSAQSAVDCRGSFYLSHQPMLQLDGLVRTPFFEYRGLRVNSPSIDWHLRQSTVHWNLPSGELYGGRIAVTGLYDVDTGKGSVAFRADGVNFGRLASACRFPGNGAETLGMLSTDAHLEFFRSWGGRELRLYGDGHLSLTQADLWRVPMFDPLGRMLDTSLLSHVTGGRASGLGRITRLDADLMFNGNRLVVTEFSTDGSVVALNGRGDYSWETDQVHGSVSGQMLENAGIFRLLFRPLSWVFFNAQLTGTPKDYKWKLSTVFSKLRGRTQAERALRPVSEPPASAP